MGGAECWKLSGRWSGQASAGDREGEVRSRGLAGQRDRGLEGKLTSLLQGAAGKGRAWWQSQA